MKSSRAGKSKARRRGGRHRLGTPAPGLEWIVVAEPGKGGRHRVSSGPAGGVLAAGVVLLAASAASPAVPPADPTGTPALAGGDRPPVENHYRSWIADRESPGPAVVGPAITADLSSTTGLDTNPSIPVVFTGDIPTTVLDAYRRARDTINLGQPGCHLPLELLAAIGKVETGHARGGQVDARGDTPRRILGPVLDGNGFAAIPDTDRGALDGDTTWDRAVGPMQFIPGTWQRWGSDGNADGRTDPHNVYDASLAAARYLCAANRDLGTPQGLDEAIFSYNHSTSYRNLVLGWMATYRNGTVVVPDAPSGPVPVFIPRTGSIAPPSTTATTVPTTPTTTPTTPTTDPTVPPSTDPAPPPSTDPTPPPSSDPAPPPSTDPTPPPSTDPTPPPSTEPPPPSTDPTPPPSTDPNPAPAGPVEGVVCVVDGLLSPITGPLLCPEH